MIRYLICIVLLCMSASYAYTQSWSEHYNSAKQSYEQDDLKSAFEHGSQSLEIYIRDGGELNTNYASILRLLGNICFEQNEYEKGLEYEKKEAAIRESKPDAEYAETLIQLAQFYVELKRYGDAEISLQRALKVLQGFFAETDGAIAECKLNLGNVCYLLDENAKAIQFFNEVFRHYHPEEKTSTWLSATYYYGTLLSEQGDHQLALAAFKNLKEYYEKNNESKSSDYATLLESIAHCHHQLGAWSDAEIIYSQIQQIYDVQQTPEALQLKILNARAINFQRMGRSQDATALFTAYEKSGKGTSASFLLNQAALAQLSSAYAKSEKYYLQGIAVLKSENKNTLLLAEALQNLAMLHNDMGNTEKAIQTLEEARSLLPADPQQLIVLENKKAMIFLKAGKSTEAEVLFRKQIELLNQQKEKKYKEWAIAMNGLASSLHRIGLLQSSDSLFQLLLNAYELPTLSKDDYYPTVLNNYATLKQARGQLLTSRGLLKKASINIQKIHGVENMSYAMTLENIAYVDLSMGQLTNAKAEIDSVVFLYHKLLGDSSSEYAAAQIALGRYLQSTGDYAQAEPCFLKAYHIVQKVKGADPADAVRASNALALFYQVMGNYEEAEPLLKFSLRSMAETSGKKSNEYSTTLQNLATLYQLSGRLQQAKPLLEEALETDRQIFGEHNPQYAIALKNLAVVHQKLGEHDQAQILLERALIIIEQTLGKDHPSYAVTISNLAALYQDKGNYEASQKAWTQSVALRKKLLGEVHPDYARSLFGLASVHFAKGEFDEANTYFQLVSQHYLQQIRDYFPSLSEKEKGAFYQKIKPVFETYQDFCIQYYMRNKGNAKGDEALYKLYNVQLVTKAILLNASNKVRQNILAHGDEALVRSYKTWVQTKEQIVQYYALSVEERNKQLNNASMLEQEANRLEKELSSRSSLFRTQVSVSDFDEKKIADILAPQEAAIEIIRIRKKFVPDSVYYIALIVKSHSNAPELIIWPHGTQLETRLFKFSRNLIKFKIQDSVSYAHYWKPLAASLAQIQHIYVSADGIFNKINLNTLRNPENHRSIIEDYNISLVSNTRELITKRVPSGSASSIYLYGFADFALSSNTQNVPVITSTSRSWGFKQGVPPLPGTKEEVDEIETLLRPSAWKPYSFMAAEASEINLKKTINPKVLHIATHGFFMQDTEVTENADDDDKFYNNPLLRSGLLLAGAQKEKQAGADDGVLTAYEAMNLTLDETELVVLSACETGLGEVKNGEGVYGLQRSFMVAGANAVIMSLWQVDDEVTKELMVTFYKTWLTGMDKQDAFRQAQLAIKQKHEMPYYWGAFVLMGQ